MKIEIWSDIMCPFCYIAKRRFEVALTQFQEKDKLEIIWKSFQLNPYLQTDINTNIHQYLADKRGISLDEAEKLNSQVEQMAKQVGLVFNNDKAILANTMRSHCFSHCAKKSGKQNDAEEVLFRSFFSDGKNVDDIDTLLDLGKEVGLDISALKKSLETDEYLDAVKHDIAEAV